MRKFLVVLPLLPLLGCGISNGTLLNTLTSDDFKKLCEEQDLVTYTCDMGSGFTYDISFGDCGTDTDTTATEMNIPASCTATVGDFRDCEDAWQTALDADPCAAPPDADCAFMNDCMGGTGTGETGTTPTGTTPE